MDKARLDTLIAQRDELRARLGELRARRAEKNRKPGEVQGPVPGDPEQSEIDRLEPQLASIESEIDDPGL